MSWSRELSFYLDLNAYGTTSVLLDGTRSERLASTPGFVQGDKMTLKLFPRQRSTAIGAASTSMQLASGSTIRMEVAASSDFDTTLVTVTGWAEQSESGVYWYTATANFGTSELDTAIGTASSLAVKVGVEIRNADNTERMSFQFDATIAREVVDGTDITGEDPIPDQMVNAAAANLRQKSDGTFQLWDYGTSKWRTPVLNNGVLGWDAGEAE